jgi:ubiquinone/menaquinone biosynthesis C-methylase UbiE
MATSVHMMFDHLDNLFISAEEGYSLAAEYYDSWKWQDFWRENEFPVVLRRLLAAKIKRGLLDVGVGTGAFLRYAAPKLPKGIRLAGVDISEGMLDRARMGIGRSAELVQADVQEHLPFENNSFDGVVMMRVANHLSQLDSALSEIARVMRPQGLFIATDFADEFAYTCTRLPSAEGKLSIKTYKHTENDWMNALGAGFSTVVVENIKKNNLQSPFAGDVEGKLSPGNSPVFKVIAARRRKSPLR